VISFKYEGLQIVALMFEANEYLFKFDRLPPCQHASRMQQFQWELEGKKSYFEKIKALKSRLLEIKGVSYVPTRCLASGIGKISSISLGLGPVTRLMTRSLYTTLNKKLSWWR